jgi:hypothetical protein
MAEQARQSALDRVSVTDRVTSPSSHKRRKSNVISHPREVAAAVAAQTQIIKAKRDELAIAIRGMTDLSQQLAASYAQQHVVIERLVQRVATLEGSTQGHDENGSPESEPAVA